MSATLLLAKYPQQAHVRERNLVALLSWAAARTKEAAPTADTPDAAIRLRIFAERILSQVDLYVQRTMAYCLQDQRTLNNIRQYLNPFNDDATEDSLAVELAAIISDFAPALAEIEVPDAQVAAWKTDRGLTQPPA